MLKPIKAFIAIMAVGCMTYATDLEAEERDPFVSIIDSQEHGSATKKIDLANLELKGIIWSDVRAIAVINEELVMSGDTYRGFKVENIDKNSVTLNDGWKTYKIFLEEASAIEKKDLINKTEEPVSLEGQDESINKPEEPVFPGRPDEPYPKRDER